MQLFERLAQTQGNQHPQTMALVIQAGHYMMFFPQVGGGALDCGRWEISIRFQGWQENATLSPG